MKRIIMLIVAVLALAGSGHASTDGVRYWNEGPLKWSDFSGKPAMRTLPSYFSGHLEIRTDGADGKLTRLSDDVRFATYALAVMDKTNSYADSTGMTEQMLRYHQLQFDILEMYRRRLQSDLNNGVAGIEADNQLKRYQQLYEEQLEQLAKMTVNGSNDYRLQEYEYEVRKVLDEYFLPPVREVSPSKVSYGLFVGTGSLIPTGGISDMFKNSWLFNIGLTAGYWRFFLKADISYGQPRFVDPHKASLTGNAWEWATNRFANQLTGTVSIGFRVLDTKRFAITPHAGGGWSSYSWNVADVVLNEDEEPVIDSEVRKVSVRDFNFMVGIDFDWHFHTVVSNKAFFSGRREQYTSSLRLTPYVIHGCYSKFNPSLSGYHVGISISYVGLARALGLE